MPLASRATATLLALLSAFGKLSEENVGAPVKTGPIVRYPPAVEAVVVRMPVTATAPAGTLPRPVTWNWRGTRLERKPLRPFPTRVSRIRVGSSGWKVVAGYVTRAGGGVKISHDAR